MTLNERVILIIEKGKFSKRNFAERIGISQTTFQDQLNGKMSIQTICSILNVFPNISAEWLLRGEGDMNRSLFDRVLNKIDVGCGNNGDVTNSNNNNVITIENEHLQERVKSLEAQNTQLLEIISNLTKK